MCLCFGMSSSSVCQPTSTAGSEAHESALSACGGFASAPESLCVSKLSWAAVCQRSALILLAYGTPPLGTIIAAQLSGTI
jgi:hypothetical protein